jgi:hypothetical protein
MVTVPSMGIAGNVGPGMGSIMEIVVADGRMIGESIGRGGAAAEDPPLRPGAAAITAPNNNAEHTSTPTIEKDTRVLGFIDTHLT